jgi:hypothetical protein
MVASAAVALAVALIACKGGPDSLASPGATASPSGIGSGTAPAATPTHVSSVAPSVTPLGPLGVDWIRVADAGLLGNGWLGAWTAGQTGIVAVGAGNGPEMVALSVDGLSWSGPVDLPADAHIDAGPMTAATSWNGRVVAVAIGNDGDGSPPVGVTWSSTDGRSWQLGAEIQGLTDAGALTPAGDRLLAAGTLCASMSGPCKAVVWATTDLVTWSPVEVERGAGMMIVAMAEGPAGHVALGVAFGGADQKDGSAPAHALGVWTSPDGLSWRRRADLPGNPDNTYVAAMTASSAGLVAVGGRVLHPGVGAVLRAAVWRSPDGATWEIVPNQDSFGRGVMSSVTFDGASLIAVGGKCDPCSAGGGIYTPDGEPTVWTSADGLAWVATSPMLSPSTVAQVFDLVLVHAGRWFIASHEPWQQRGEPTPISIWMSPPG